ncbi:MAG: SPOR domain-containing protein [Azoarcus sp.]|jgi:DedD protein|nr:SPOR domain-containing protein [Azoarcus sp.]
MSRKIAPPTDPRRSALTRAGLAVSAAVGLLLTALWIEVDSGGGGAPPPAADAVPEAPPAAEQSGDYPMFALDAASSENVMSVDTLVSEAVENAVVPEVMPTPPEAGPETDPGAGADVPTASQSAPSQPASSPLAAVPVGETPAKTPAPPLPDGYFVQLGVFDSMDNAKSLFDNALASGLPMHIQARVVAGPFRGRGEAEAAKRRLKGIAGGIVLPPRKSAKAVAKADGKPKRRMAKAVAKAGSKPKRRTAK